jgi:putative ABC transport system ATP-binding protein
MAKKNKKRSDNGEQQPPFKARRLVPDQTAIDELPTQIGLVVPTPDMLELAPPAIDEQPTRPEAVPAPVDQLPTQQQIVPAPVDSPLAQQEVVAPAIDEQPTKREAVVAPVDPLLAQQQTVHAPVDHLPTMPYQAIAAPNVALEPLETATAMVYPQTMISAEPITARAEPMQSTGKPVARDSEQTPVIAVRNLTKTYGVGKKTLVHALRGVSLEVYPGEFVAILGPSGSGKSTFMNLLGCLDRPTKGEYWLAGRLVSRMSNDDLATIRNQLLGFVFQGFNLLGRSTALKNVMLPMVYAGISRNEQERRARKVLTLVGLGERVNHKPPEMSGGQQQRVAIARALVNGPSLLLADEPTGNLDSRTSVEIIAMLQALNDQGLTIVLVTHDLKVADYAKRQVAFLDGCIVRDEPVSTRRLARNEVVTSPDESQ